MPSLPKCIINNNNLYPDIDKHITIHQSLSEKPTPPQRHLIQIIPHHQTLQRHHIMFLPPGTALQTQPIVQRCSYFQHHNIRQTLSVLQFFFRSPFFPSELSFQPSLPLFYYDFLGYHLPCFADLLPQILLIVEKHSAVEDHEEFSAVIPLVVEIVPFV